MLEQARGEGVRTGGRRGGKKGEDRGKEKGGEREGRGRRRWGSTHTLGKLVRPFHSNPYTNPNPQMVMNIGCGFELISTPERDTSSKISPYCLLLWELFELFCDCGYHSSIISVLK